MVDTQGNSEQFELAIQWQGGYQSRHRGIRSIHRFQQLRDYDRVLARAIELRRLRYSDRAIAETLNSEGFRSARRQRPFSKDSINRLLSGHGIGERPHRRMGFASQLAKEEVWLQDLAVRLEMPPVTLHTWVRCGWVSARKVAAAGGMLAIKVSQNEWERLQALRDHCRQFPSRSAPAILKTPRTREK